MRLFLLSIFCFLSLFAKNPKLILSETGEGIHHKITVESPHNFRIAFEACLNYGLSEWFDLRHDPEGKRDLTDNETDYIPFHEQGALFNQCINPDDLIAHTIGAKTTFKDLFREIKILENSSAKVVLENKHHPILNIKNETLLFQTRYTIYPNGRIYINNTFSALQDQKITMWRNSIVGLSDPSYLTQIEKGQGSFEEDLTFKVKGTQWSKDQWQGYLLKLPKWKQVEVVSNTENTLTVKTAMPMFKLKEDLQYELSSNPVKFGWLRGDSVKFPKSWHNKKSEYIYAYWDPETPQPFTNWTKANIMLIPHPDNPKQGSGAGLHGWKGFKRMYYEFGAFDLKVNEPVSQEYLLVLGTQGSEVLPDLREKDVLDKIVQKYTKQAE